METIMIPRVTVLTNIIERFQNLQTLCGLSGFTLSSDLAASDLCKPAQKDSLSSRLLRSVWNAISLNNRRLYDTLYDDSNFNTLFCRETRKELKRQKKELVKLISKHERLLMDLAEARKTCWFSEAKMKKFDLIVQTQKSALTYHPADVGVRHLALKRMTRELEQWMSKHEANQTLFTKKLLAETSYSQKIEQLASDLENGMLAAIQTTIETVMAKNSIHISTDDVANMSRMLLRETARWYKFEPVGSDPCQKVWVKRPVYEDSSCKIAFFNREEFETTKTLTGFIM